MKKIQLSDGMPSSIAKSQVQKATLNLMESLQQECKKSGLSYVEINKALYLADKELYLNIISTSQHSQ